MTKTRGFKFNIARFFLFIIGFIILWICGDFLISTFVLHSPFIFTVAKDILIPLLISAPAAAFTQLLTME